MSQQSDMADAVYKRLQEGPVSAATLVRDLRKRWGAEFRASSVHGFVREVATCLLHRDDIEVGHIEEGRFIAWNLEPWDADRRIDKEFIAMDHFLDDETQYVFRIKHT